MFRVDIFNITSKNFELVQEASLKLFFPPFVSMMPDLKTNFGAAGSTQRAKIEESNSDLQS